MGRIFRGNAISSASRTRRMLHWLFWGLLCCFGTTALGGERLAEAPVSVANANADLLPSAPEASLKPCYGAHLKRVLLTGFLLEFPEQKSGEESSLPLNQVTAIELARRLRASARVLADTLPYFFPYASAARAPELWAFPHSAEAASEMTMQARNRRAQYVVSGIYRDFGRESDWRGRQRRTMLVEVFLHDGVSGQVLAKQMFSGEVRGDVTLRPRPLIGSPAFYQTTFGQAWGALLDKIAHWVEEEATCRPFSTRVLRVDGVRLHIDAGTESGLSAGGALTIQGYSSTTASSGRVTGEEKPVCTDALIREAHPQSSVVECKEISGENSVKAGEMIFIKH